jgi:hypothetical protein
LQSQLSWRRLQDAQLAGYEAGSYTGGPANWQVWRWGRPLSFTFLGHSNRACKFHYGPDFVKTVGPELIGAAFVLTAR